MQHPRSRLGIGSHFEFYENSLSLRTGLVSITENVVFPLQQHLILIFFKRQAIRSESAPPPPPVAGNLQVEFGFRFAYKKIERRRVHSSLRGSVVLPPRKKVKRRRPAAHT